MIEHDLWLMKCLCYVGQPVTAQALIPRSGKADVNLMTFYILVTRRSCQASAGCWSSTLPPGNDFLLTHIKDGLVFQLIIFPPQDNSLCSAAQYSVWQRNVFCSTLVWLCCGFVSCHWFFLLVMVSVLYSLSIQVWGWPLLSFKFDWCWCSFIRARGHIAIFMMFTINCFPFTQGFGASVANCVSVVFGLRLIWERSCTTNWHQSHLHFHILL